MNDTALLPVIIATAAIGLIPFLVITTTAFLKISIVLFLVRNALGTQQTPPTLVMYAIAIVLTAYVSAPLASEVYGRLTAPGVDFSTAEGLQAAGASIVGPLRASLERFTPVQERDFLLSAAQRIWPHTCFKRAYDLIQENPGWNRLRTALTGRARLGDRSGFPGRRRNCRASCVRDSGRRNTGWRIHRER